eukprot:3659129-Amphidinium_carterae.1
MELSLHQWASVARVWRSVAAERDARADTPQIEADRYLGSKGDQTNKPSSRCVMRERQAEPTLTMGRKHVLVHALDI